MWNAVAEVQTSTVYEIRYEIVNYVENVMLR